MEMEDTTHSIQVLDDARSLSFRQQNRAKNGEYEIAKTYATDPKRNTLLIQVSFRVKSNLSKYMLFVLYDPSLNNSGRHDSAWSESGTLLARDGDIASALISQPQFEDTNNHFLGEKLTTLFVLSRAKREDGNVIQTGRVNLKRYSSSQSLNFTLALSFGETPALAAMNARMSLRDGFSRILKQYQNGWHSYSAGLPRINFAYQRQFNIAAMVLRALEDKTYRGAMIASPSHWAFEGPHTCSAGVAFDEHWCTTWTSATPPSQRSVSSSK